MERAPGTFDEITCFTRNSAEQVTIAADVGSTQCNMNPNLQRKSVYTYNTYDDITQVVVSPAPGSTNTNTSATTTYNFQPATITLSTGGSATLDELTYVTDPINHNTSYGYDPNTGSLTSVTDPTNQRVWNYTYYPDGLLETATDPKKNPPTQYFYNSFGDLREIIDPLGLTTQYTTDTVGRITSVKAPAGDTTSYGYDVLDDINTVTDPNSNVSLATYDFLGQLSSAIDPNGNTTSYKWADPSLNTLTVTDANGKTTVTNFDLSGKKTDQTDRRGVKTVLTYDNLRRLTKAVYNSNDVSGIPQRTLIVPSTGGYNLLDQLLSVTDDLGGNGGSSSGNSIILTWDGLDNLTSELTKYTSGPAYTASATYQYDYAGRVVGLNASQNGNSASYLYCYDQDNELQSIYSGSGVTCASSNPLTALTYDLDGNRTSLTESANGGSVVTNYNPYDADNRPQGQSFTGNGNSLGGLSYSCGNDDRLLTETGSLATLSLPPATSTISYTPTNQVATWNGAPAQYDAASNLTLDPSSSGAEATLTWDERNLLSSVSGGPVGSFTLQYDAKGRRENDTTPGGGTNYYLDSGQIVVLGNNVNLKGGGSQTLSSYVTLPGTGEVVGFAELGGLAPQTPGNATPIVPLHDINGSTLGSPTVLTTRLARNGVTSPSGLLIKAAPRSATRSCLGACSSIRPVITATTVLAWLIRSPAARQPTPAAPTPAPAVQEQAPMKAAEPAWSHLRTVTRSLRRSAPVSSQLCGPSERLTHGIRRSPSAWPQSPQSPVFSTRYSAAISSAARIIPIYRHHHTLRPAPPAPRRSYRRATRHRPY